MGPGEEQIRSGMLFLVSGRRGPEGRVVLDLRSEKNFKRTPKVKNLRVVRYVRQQGSGCSRDRPVVIKSAPNGGTDPRTLADVSAAGIASRCEAFELVRPRHGSAIYKPCRGA